MRNQKIKNMTIASMLCAIGIIIPMFSPLKIIVEPASFTLASHVAIMIGMFLSPPIAITVSLGTTLGFLLGGFPITVVARATSHIVFVIIGSYAIMKKPSLLTNTKQFIVFSLMLSCIHAICEVLVVLPFYFSDPNASNFMYSIFLLVGVGTILHSMVDFFIARVVYQAIFSTFRSNKKGL